MSQLPTRVIIKDTEGTEVDRGRWLAGSLHGILIISDADPTGWSRDYRYPAYRSEFESDEWDSPRTVDIEGGFPGGGQLRGC